MPGSPPTRIARRQLLSDWRPANALAMLASSSSRPTHGPSARAARKRGGRRADQSDVRATSPGRAAASLPGLDQSTGPHRAETGEERSLGRLVTPLLPVRANLALISG